MVSGPQDPRAMDRWVYTLLVANALVLALSAWLFYRASVHQAMILYVLNGGCLP